MKRNLQTLAMTHALIDTTCDEIVSLHMNGPSAHSALATYWEAPCKVIEIEPKICRIKAL